MNSTQLQGACGRQRERRGPVALIQAWRSERRLRDRRVRGERIAPDLQRRGIASHLRADAPIYALIAAHAIATALVCWSFDAMYRFDPFLYVQSWLGIFVSIAPPIAVLAGCFYLACSRETDLARKARGFAEKAVSPRLLANVVMLLGLCVFLGCFTNLKTTIPEVGGFTSESVVADIDRMIHFGADPWTYFGDVFWRPDVLAVIEYNYGVLWFICMAGVLVYFTFGNPGDDLRRRYLICFIATWTALGNVSALLVRAAGPAFYHHVTGDSDRFAVILQRLASRTQEHSAASLQNYLWTAYNSKELYLGGGISAFPSMHVAVAAMNFFFLAEINRKLGLAALLYLAVVLASSVTLAWHYAIDGYFSIGVGYLIYAGVKAAHARRPLALRPIPAM